MTLALVYPLEGNIWVTQTYQQHIDNAAEWLKKYPGSTKYNPGIDFGCPSSTAVYAAAAGVVDKVEADNTGYGNLVKIRHPGGYYTLYAHLDQAVVSPGQEVATHQMIAWSDNTGHSTGPHLHFELRHLATPIDPTLFFIAVEPEPTQPTPTGWPDFPILKRARALAKDGLSIRQGPGREFLLTGSLNLGDNPEILGIRQDGEGNPWAHIGWDQWSCWNYRGEKLMEWA